MHKKSVGPASSARVIDIVQRHLGNAREARAIDAISEEQLRHVRGGGLIVPIIA